MGCRNRRPSLVAGRSRNPEEQAICGPGQETAFTRQICGKKAIFANPPGPA